MHSFHSKLNVEGCDQCVYEWAGWTQQTQSWLGLVTGVQLTVETKFKISKLRKRLEIDVNATYSYQVPTQSLPTSSPWITRFLMLRPIYSHISFPHNRDWLLRRLRIRFARTYYYMLQTSSSDLPVAQDPNCAVTLNLSILLFSSHSLSLLVGMVFKLYVTFVGAFLEPAHMQNDEFRRYIVRRTTTEYYSRITHYIHFSKWESSTRSSPCFFEHYFCIIGLHNVTIGGHDCLQEKKITITIGKPVS